MQPASRLIFGIALMGEPEVAGTRMPTKSVKTHRRNDPCPCGRGKKFKHCCLNQVAEEIRYVESR